ncbi:MAG: hypothetical protein LBO82_00080, partial [Synergistaceae bacterium]|nr:hypothetical protein [Synergistaceae bacterium]
NRALGERSAGFAESEWPRPKARQTEQKSYTCYRRNRKKPVTAQTPYVRFLPGSGVHRDSDAEGLNGYIKANSPLDILRKYVTIKLFIVEVFFLIT